MDRRNALKTLGFVGAAAVMPGLLSASPAPSPPLEEKVVELEKFPNLRSAKIFERYLPNQKRLMIGFYRNEGPLTCEWIDETSKKTLALYGDRNPNEARSEQSFLSHQDHPFSLLVRRFHHPAGQIHLILEFDWDEDRWVTFLDFVNAEKRRPCKYPCVQYEHIVRPVEEVIVYDGVENVAETYLSVRDGAFFEFSPMLTKSTPEGLGACTMSCRRQLASSRPNLAS